MGADERFDRAPDGIVPLVGYRLWRVQDNPDGEPVLLSLNQPSTEWSGATRGWVSASCRFGLDLSVFDASEWVQVPHRVPHEACTCGFYAMKELDPQLVLVASMGSFPGKEGFLVLGRVELAGKVIEHDLGYRAEMARIVELIPLRGDKRPVKAIARRAGVRVARAVKVPRVPMRDRVRERLSARQATEARSPAERRNQDVFRFLVLAGWIVVRILSSVHQSGGTP